jgi:SAM-dependent methyltransferase
MAFVCRSCGESNCKPVLDLGTVPLVDRLVHPDDLLEDEPLYSLSVALCGKCSLVQIVEAVPPDLLFCHEYPYYSSYSSSWLEHAQRHVNNLITTRGLNSDNLVVELASNDGYLLQYFHQAGIPVLGVDPAEGPASMAIERGIPTIVDFFDRDMAARLSSQGQSADIIVANNVLAHVADLNGFVASMSILLKPDGLITIEVPYLDDLVKKYEFDTIYHEHHCYFSVTSLDILFRRHELYINHIERLATHGGSIRLFVGKEDIQRESVNSLLNYEASRHVKSLSYFEDFLSEVKLKAEALKKLIDRLHHKGKKIAVYGAAAKGVILLGAAKIDHRQVICAMDNNPFKHGKLMPGSHIPIVSTNEISTVAPDYLILLPWNLKDEIVEQETAFREKGGKFIIPLPYLEII